MIKLDGIATFVAIAEAGSISEAARLLIGKGEVIPVAQSDCSDALAALRFEAGHLWTSLCRSGSMRANIAREARQ
jgi:hypothetical protein